MYSAIVELGGVSTRRKLLPAGADGSRSLEGESLELSLLRDRVRYGLLWSLDRLFIGEHFIYVTAILRILNDRFVWCRH